MLNERIFCWDEFLPTQILHSQQVYTLGLSVRYGSVKHNIVKFPCVPQPFEIASVVAEIPARWQMHPSYMHSFAITDNYFIIIEQPLSVSLMKVVKEKLSKRVPTLPSLSTWFGNECTQISVVCRRTGDRKFTFKTGSIFFFHTINAYERDECIVLDMCCYRDASIIANLYIEALKNVHSIENYSDLTRSRPLRFVLPIGEKHQHPAKSLLWSFLRKVMRPFSASSMEIYIEKHVGNDSSLDSTRGDSKFWMDFESHFNVQNLVELENSDCRAYRLEDSTIYCVPERLCELSFETPRINESMDGKSYRFFYAMSVEIDTDMPGAVRNPH